MYVFHIYCSENITNLQSELTLFICKDLGCYNMSGNFDVLFNFSDIY